MIYDPERALWMPNRRKFFLMGLAAGIAPFLPDMPKPDPWFNPGFETGSLGWQGWMSEGYTVEFEMKKNGGQFEMHEVVFAKDETKPRLFLVDGKPRNVDECLISWPKDLTERWGLTEHWVTPVTVTYQTGDVFYIQQLMAFDNAKPKENP